MNLMSIQEAIFKTVDVIVEKRLKSLQVNYCVLGIIDGEKMIDEKTKEVSYMVNYQDIKIKAYPIASNEVDYKNGELVYTLVINGDLSKKRLILCRA